MKELDAIADVLDAEYHRGAEDDLRVAGLIVAALGLGPLAYALDACDSQCVHEPDCLVNATEAAPMTPVPGGEDAK